MGACLAAEVFDETENWDDDSPQIIQGSTADIARYMSYMKPADARLEVELRKLP